MCCRGRGTVVGRLRPAVQSSIVEVRVLGPVEVVRSGAVVALTRQERVFIAALALRSPEPVAFGLLEDALWREAAPRRPDKALQSLVLRLRRTLGTDAIETRSAGVCPCTGHRRRCSCVRPHCRRRQR